MLAVTTKEDLFGSGTETRGPVSGGKANTLDVSSARDLLLLLVASELERLTTWHNPLHVKTKNVVDDSKLVGVDQSMKETKWRKLVSFAWGTSPLLAVRLSERFPSEGVSGVIKTGRKFN